MPKHWQCTRCARSFDQNKEYQLHKKCCVETFKCDQCGKCFRHKRTLTSHIKVCEGSTVVPESVGEYECAHCCKRFTRKADLKRHLLSCKTRDEEFECARCCKKFPEEWRLKRHLPSCKVRDENPTTCNYCEKTFSRRYNTIRHQQQCRNRPNSTPRPPRSTPKTHPPRSAGVPTSKRLCTCRQCGESYESFRALRHHQLEVHVGGRPMHARPDWLTDAPDELQTMYRWHENVILAGHDLSNQLIHRFNFPATDTGFSAQELENQARYIYASEGKSFRLQLAAGLLLQNTETLEYRYFHPHRNAWMFDRPFMVKNQRDLESLIEMLKSFDLHEHARISRPSTKWTAVAVTNLRYTVYLTSFPLGCVGVRLPDFVMNHRYIKALVIDEETRRPYADNKCFFRALATSIAERDGLPDIEEATDEYCDVWRRFKDIDGQEFEGVSLDDFPELEQVFSTNLHVLTLEEDEQAQSLYTSTRHFQHDLYLNSWDSHLSLITDIAKYSKKFVCVQCESLFNRLDVFKKHAATCTGVDSTKFVYPGGFYKHKQTIFDKIESHGIDTSDRPVEFFAVYDYECMLRKEPQPDVPNNTEWLAEHVPISVSIASNVPSFEDPHCIIDTDLDTLVEKMVAYLDEIREAAADLNDLAIQGMGADLERKKQEFETKADELMQAGAPNELDQEYRRLAEDVDALISGLKSYIQTLPVCGFNSGRYDLCLIQKRLVELLALDNPEEKGYVIKKANQYACISANNLKFLDISNYLAATTSYASFLRAFKCTENKSYFPYEYLDSEERLAENQLPGYESFHSSLKGFNTLHAEYKAYEDLIAAGMSEADALAKLRLDARPPTGLERYDELQQLWARKGFRTMRDYLEYYNNLDVGPFVEAVEKMMRVYTDRGVSMLRDAISVPGISRIELFKSARNLNITFPIFGPEDMELHKLFKRNTVGGPAVIHHRFHAKDETFIRGNEDYPVSEILGLDANNLYGHSLSSELSCGTYVVRHEDDQYYPHKREKFMIAFHYLDWVSHTENIQIDHKLNAGREHRVCGYLLDGWNAATQTCWEFHGCFFHGHEHLWRHLAVDDPKRVMLEKRWQRTVNRTQILRDHGITVHEMWECDFRTQMKQDPALKAFIASKQPAFFQQTGTRAQTVESLLDGVRSGTLYGFLEVDIEAPETDAFLEFPPLFCNADIPFSKIGKHMQDYVKETQLNEHLNAGLAREDFRFKEPPPRRLLVGGLKAERVLLHSDLLQWYLDHQMTVSRVYRVIEFHKARCFKGFIDEMTDLRRSADRDPDQSIIADTAKLLCNSAYGSLLMNKEAHQDIKYVRGKDQATKYVKTARFKSMTDMSDGLYEVHLQKQTVELDLPSYIGSQILQLAKLQILRFVHDYLMKRCDRNKFEILHMDTDSIYLAHSGVKDGVPCFQEIILDEYKDEVRSQMEDNHHLVDIDPETCFFPRTCCDDHKARDKRAPGLMKIEYEKGTRYIGLASKTYWIASPNSEKYCCKGIQKDKLKTNTGERYMSVLTTKQQSGARNRGFRSRYGTIWTYSQYRKGLPYLYVKREVQADGVSTKPLQITLNPWN